MPDRALMVIRLEEGSGGRLPGDVVEVSHPSLGSSPALSLPRYGKLLLTLEPGQTFVDFKAQWQRRQYGKRDVRDKTVRARFRLDIQALPSDIKTPLLGNPRPTRVPAKLILSKLIDQAAEENLVKPGDEV